MVEFILKGSWIRLQSMAFWSVNWLKSGIFVRKTFHFDGWCQLSVQKLSSYFFLLYRSRDTLFHLSIFSLGHYDLFAIITDMYINTLISTIATLAIRVIKSILPLTINCFHLYFSISESNYSSLPWRAHLHGIIFHSIPQRTGNIKFVSPSCHSSVSILCYPSEGNGLLEYYGKIIWWYILKLYITIRPNISISFIISFSLHIWQGKYWHSHLTYCRLRLCSGFKEWPQQILRIASTSSMDCHFRNEWLKSNKFSHIIVFVVVCFPVLYSGLRYDFPWLLPVLVNASQLSLSIAFGHGQLPQQVLLLPVVTTHRRQVYDAIQRPFPWIQLQTT